MIDSYTEAVNIVTNQHLPEGYKMSRSATVIADNVIELMHKQNLNCATIPWAKFYTLCKRDRIKESFLEALEDELKKKSFLLNIGHAVVTVTKDFNFAELKNLE